MRTLLIYDCDIFDKIIIITGKGTIFNLFWLHKEYIYFSFSALDDLSISTSFEEWLHM